MKGFEQIVGLCLALTACAAPPLPGQTAPPADGSLERLHMYEVIRDPSAQEAPSPGFIEVSGNASVDVPVDRARISFAVESRDESASAAAAANANVMDAVLRAVRAGRFEGLELETFGYALRPEYSVAQNRARTIEAYTALNNVRATVLDVDQVGRLIDAAIGGGANRVGGIAFDAVDTEPARTRALAEAVGAARGQAAVIAQSLGYELGPPLEVRGGTDRPMPRMALDYVTSARMAQEAPTPIEAGDQTVSANVTIRFALGPARPGS